VYSEPLPDKELETNNKTTAVAMQQICKHASRTIVIVENGVLYVARAEELKR
jgi:hypothetical protein